jgi:hypothetical protein
MKWFAIILFAITAQGFCASPMMPADAAISPYDLTLEFQPSARADGYWYYSNGIYVAPTTGTNVFIVTMPLGITTYNVTATNVYGVSAFSNPVTVTNLPVLTNTAMTVTSTYTWSATNPPGPQMFFALCSSTNPSGPWKPVMTASKTNVFPSGVNTVTKTNF